MVTTVDASEARAGTGVSSSPRVDAAAAQRSTSVHSSVFPQALLADEKYDDDNENEEETKPTSLKAIGRHAPTLLHTTSSQLASASSTFVFYPFDMLKTRFMAQDGTTVRQHNGQVYRSIRQALVLIYREEGWRALFRGCPVALIGSVSAWGVYMLLYRELCNWTEFTSYVGRSSVSIVSSCVSSCVVNPIFLIKSRMQLEEANRSSHYRTFWTGIRYTVQTSGMRSLWRGLSLQLFLILPNALSIPTYDTLKSILLRYRWHHDVATELNLLEIGLCSTLTKLWILVLSHPLIMMKVRMQDERALVGRYQYRSVLQSVSNVFRTQGARGMYRGFTTSLLHTLPRSFLHYLVYEKTLSFLCQRKVPSAT